MTAIRGFLIVRAFLGEADRCLAQGPNQARGLGPAPDLLAADRSGPAQEALGSWARPRDHRAQGVTEQSPPDTRAERQTLASTTRASACRPGPCDSPTSCRSRRGRRPQMQPLPAQNSQAPPCPTGGQKRLQIRRLRLSRRLQRIGGLWSARRYSRCSRRTRLSRRWAADHSRTPTSNPPCRYQAQRPRRPSRHEARRGKSSEVQRQANPGPGTTAGAPG